MGADPVSWGVIAASVAGAAVGGTAATMLNKPKTPKVKDSTVLQDDEAAKKAADEAANNAAAQKKQQRLGYNIELLANNLMDWSLSLEKTLADGGFDNE